MILGFKTVDKGKPTRFVEKIDKGTKIHTMRLGGRWRPGMPIQFATGVRTKNYKKFKDGYCISTQHVSLSVVEEMTQCKIFVDGRILSLDESVEFAHNDGFDNLASFWMWFNENWDGQLVHWTDKKY